MNIKTKALLTSFLRVLAATTLASYLSLGVAPLDLRVDDLAAIVNATIAALILTAVNYLRSGETRFGRGSENMGMGGTDTLTPPDGVILTPDGPVDPPVELVIPEALPQPVEEPVEELVEQPVEPVIRSVPLSEVRKKAPVKRAPRKTPPKS